MRNSAVFVFISVLAPATAASAQPGGTAVRPSFGVDIGAWPFAFAFEGGAWLNHSPGLGGVHVGTGAIRLRGSLPIANGPNPLGPPLPLAAAALTILF